MATFSIAYASLVSRKKPIKSGLLRGVSHNNTLRQDNSQVTSQPKNSSATAFDALCEEPNLALAMQIASGAGKLLLDRPNDLGVQTKSTATDVVTLMDQRAEAFIVSELGKHRPNDAILGEEGANQAGTSGFQWVIDPIDGTVNYLHQVPHWCVSIGLMEESTGLGLAGVVYVPVLDQMYISSRGLGAWVIEHGTARELKVSGCNELSQALMGTGFGYSSTRRASQARVLQEVLPKVADIRRLGSCAVDLCLVADGVLDGYYERGVNAWDHAAGELIAREAGAISSGLYGNPIGNDMIVVANPAIHAELVAILEANQADQD
jgi:myo-inositol-1(or 4)-monophosphatase